MQQKFKKHAFIGKKLEQNKFITNQIYFICFPNKCFANFKFANA
jgi:hypothetical protein